MPTLTERSKAGMQMWQQAKKKALTLRGGQVAQGPHWGTYWTKEDFFREYNRILDQAINARAGIEFKGRKNDEDYQTHLRRDKYRLQDIANRIRVYQFESPECQKRFSALLASYYENEC